MAIRIFLSAVSDEFRDYRDQLRHDLTRHNVEVKVQEDFKDLGGDTLDEMVGADDFEAVAGGVEGGEDLLEMAQEASVIKLVNEIIIEAVNERASVAERATGGARTWMSMIEREPDVMQRDDHRLMVRQDACEDVRALDAVECGHRFVADQHRHDGALRVGQFEHLGEASRQIQRARAALGLALENIERAQRRRQTARRQTCRVDETARPVFESVTKSKV